MIWRWCLWCEDDVDFNDDDDYNRYDDDDYNRYDDWNSMIWLLLTYVSIVCYHMLYIPYYICKSLPYVIHLIIDTNTGLVLVFAYIVYDEYTTL
jgi:hypothetical protein